ncbi:MAG: GTP-binding protein [Planctomycetota bacterium]
MTDSDQSPEDATTRVPVVILNGFLGSGKTTLMTSLLVQSREKDLSVGVVVNDMSEIDIDGHLVARTEFFTKGDPRLQSIHSYVLSSTQGIDRLQDALVSILANDSPELIIIETSGSCHPLPLIEFFRTQPHLVLIGVLALIDIAMVDQDYNAGELIVPIIQRNQQSEQRDTTNLLVEQVMFCSHLLLTKADRIHVDKLERIAQSIHALNPLVAVFSVPFGNLPIEDILGMPEYNYHRVAQLIQEVKPVLEAERDEDRPYNLATRVIEDDRPFHPQRLWDVCNHYLGEKIYRSKGFFYLASRDNLSLLWNQANTGISLELVGHWRAGILEDENNGLDEMETAGLRERLKNAKGRFGDRCCDLTVIGDRSQVDVFADALEQCLLTEGEIQHWRSGGEFPDPWPDSYATYGR